MTKLVILLALPALALAVLWPASWPLSVLVTLVVAVVLGSVLGRPTRSQTPPTISRIPTRYEQRRWGYGLGLAIGFGGAFPFIYIRRRFRS